jgi:hypothetical protein
VKPEDRDRFATIGQAFLAKVAQRLQQVKPEDLSPADLARWTDVAAKLVQAGNHRPPYDRDARLAAERADDPPDQQPSP